MNDLIRRVTLGRHTKMVTTTFFPGDTVEVAVLVRDFDKEKKNDKKAAKKGAADAGRERIQNFRGTVIKLQGRGISRTFTVRKMSDGIGVERTFPFASPAVESVKLIAHGKVRRAKLYYLRGLRGKKARINFELVTEEKKVVAPKATAAAPAPDQAAE
jgi:large subunit ribosomal protein L19